MYDMIVIIIAEIDKSEVEKKDIENVQILNF